MCPKQYLISDVISLTLISDQQVASCTFYQFGAAGRQVGLNALCILTLNILVDKVGEKRGDKFKESVEIKQRIEFH